MIGYGDYLQLLPKTELHCHFTSTMSAGQFIRLADRYGVELATTDPQRLFDFADLSDFLTAFRAAHDVLKAPEDLAEVAYAGVRLAVASGALRYREYYLNPQYFQDRGLSYRQLLEPVLDGLRSAETDLGVGFRIVIAINRHDSPSAALELVEQIIAQPYDEVVGLGMDDLTPEGTEDPLRFTEAYARAKQVGLRLTAHVGETDGASAVNVRDAIDELHCDRIDHGYRVVDDPELTRRARDSGIPFTTTPFSTTICSGWTLGPDHRIARMIREGLAVTVSTDDAMFFRTDVGREYREALPLLGVDADGAKRIALAGIDAAFCDDDTKANLRRQFTAEMLTLDALLDVVQTAGAVRRWAGE
jgi:adenosine deaminase